MKANNDNQIFPLQNQTCNESPSSKSDAMSLTDILGDEFPFSFENHSQQPNTALDYLLKTRGVITNYGKFCAKFLDLQQNEEASINATEFLDFESEDEEIKFSSEDYINAITKLVKEETLDKDKDPKQFKREQNKMTLDFNQCNPKNRLNFINSSLRKMFNRLVVLNNGRDNSKKIKKIKVFSCKYCNRNFDDGRKLGGHMSKFHCFKMNNITL